MNKTKTYILIAAVLGIWGTIGYKIINGLSPDNPVTIEQNYNVAFNPKISTQIDTFSIQNVEKDPFLGTLASNKKTGNITARELPKTKLPENNPKITYGGLIKKQNTSDQVFVVNINNKQHLLKKGQVVDSVTLLKGNTKTITIRYKNKPQNITRN